MEHWQLMSTVVGCDPDSQLWDYSIILKQIIGTSRPGRYSEKQREVKSISEASLTGRPPSYFIRAIEAAAGAQSKFRNPDWRNS